MNIITDALPECVEYKGKNYAVKTDFKVWLKFHSIITDKKRTPAEKSIDAILCCFDSEKCKNLPETIEDTMSALFKFFSGNQDAKDGKKASKGERVFDFTEDSGYIYAAFFQEYGIDLAKYSMHWYRFLALFYGLSDDTKLRKIIAWRGINIAEIKDPKRREFYRTLKKLYGLKGGEKINLSEGSIADEISRAF